ncbi:sensor domain-containing protein [Amycolatopsis taiwanensis]|uniref:sensor domain-containing protein n=1 Tax=Amycolatopsis taiwanensis TaxID=342230 RepID=UPI000486B934|nr:sensor domain-containing protein [Amycolatopsis taiwanensis]
MTYVERDGRRPRPPVGGSLLYLLMNLPLGIVAFVSLVALTAVGLSTSIIWVGVPVLALLLLGLRGAALAERARVHSLLGTYVATPYRPLPDGSQKARWAARLKDTATWRDFVYFLVLFPLGIGEFVVIVTSWALGLGFAALPIYFRYLPDGIYAFPANEVPWITVDSTVSALPLAALGVLLLGLAIILTRALAGFHARFARSLLGPGSRARRIAEDAAPALVTDGPVAG